MAWLIVANSNVCYFYQYIKKPKKLVLIKKIDHPQSKLKNTALVSDAPGHYKTNTSARGVFSPHKEPKEIEHEHFAMEIAKELNLSKSKGEYDELILVSLSHMIGLIQKHLDVYANDCIIKTYKKDYTKFNEAELLKILKEPLKMEES
jgi:protein required for attachment to host cells